MLKQAVFFALVVMTAVLAFSPVVQTGQVIHILFDFDLLLLIFTGESDPTVLTTRHIDWYPNVGALRIIVSVALTCLAIYMMWKVGDPDPALGTTEAGRRSKRFVQGGDLEVLDGPAEGVAPAVAEIMEPARLLQDHTRPADVLFSAEAQGDIVEIEHEPSDHSRRRDRGAGRLHEAE